MIEINNLTKIYRREKENLTILKNLNFRVAEGEILAIMGPSGIGKTTLLNIIAGLDTDVTGEVIINGQNLKELSRAELDYYRNSTVGFIFQEFNLLPHLSALENVIVPLMFSAVTHHKAKEDGLRSLEVVGLKDFWNRKPSELSGGQKQRVAVARALINKPKIILADEPTANLDSKTEKSVLDLILRLTRDEGVTLVISTHRQDLAANAERTLFMEEIQEIPGSAHQTEGEKVKL